MQKTATRKQPRKTTRNEDLAFFRDYMDKEKQYKDWSAVIKNCRTVAGWLISQDSIKPDVSIAFLGVQSEKEIAEKRKWLFGKDKYATKEVVKPKSYADAWTFFRHREHSSFDAYRIIDGQRHFLVREKRLALTSLKDLLILRSNSVLGDDKYPFGKFPDDVLPIPAIDVRSDHQAEDKQAIESYLHDHKQDYAQTQVGVYSVYDQGIVDVNPDTGEAIGELYSWDMKLVADGLNDFISKIPQADRTPALEELVAGKA